MGSPMYLLGLFKIPSKTRDVMLACCESLMLILSKELSTDFVGIFLNKPILLNEFEALSTTP